MRVSLPVRPIFLVLHGGEADATLCLAETPADKWGRTPEVGVTTAPKVGLKEVVAPVDDGVQLGVLPAPDSAVLVHRATQAQQQVCLATTRLSAVVEHVRWAEEGSGLHPRVRMPDRLIA